MINSWSVAVRHTWDFPFNMHRRFIEPLGGTHAQAIIMSNYVRFIQSIRKCNKLSVIYLLEKVRSNLETMTGSNVRHILDQLEEDIIFNKIKPKQLRKTFSFEKLEQNEIGRLTILKL